MLSNAPQHHARHVGAGEQLWIVASARPSSARYCLLVTQHMHLPHTIHTCANHMATDNCHCFAGACCHNSTQFYAVPTWNGSIQPSLTPTHTSPHPSTSTPSTHWPTTTYYPFAKPSQAVLPTKHHAHINLKIRQLPIRFASWHTHSNFTHLHNPTLTHPSVMHCAVLGTLLDACRRRQMQPARVQPNTPTCR